MQQLVEIQFLYMVSAITKTKHIYFMCEIPKRIKMCLNDPQIWHLIFQTKLQDHLKEKKKKKIPRYLCNTYLKIFLKNFAQIRFTFLRMWKISLLTRLRLMMSGTVSVTSITNCSSFPYCVTLRRWITCHRNADISRRGGTTRRRAERGRAWGGEKKKNKGGADKYKYKLKIYRSSYFWKVLMNFIVIQMYNLFLVLNGYCS